jgi:hypothetical protein
MEAKGEKLNKEDAPHVTKKRMWFIYYEILMRLKDGKNMFLIRNCYTCIKK